MEIAIDITKQKLAEETLKQTQEQLEKLVAERTAKLFKYNEQLKLEVKKRKETEESLRESEERYRQLIGHSQNMIAIYIDEKLAFINKTGAELLGANSTDEIIGKSIWDFVHPNRQESVKEKIKYMHNNPKSIDPPSREKIIRLDGSVIDLETTVEILIDEKEIRQLIYNLCRNGLQAMPAGGTLTIKTFTDVNEVVLAIKDQGNGINPEVLEKLGTPFFTTKDDGTGLGLSICYSIAARHNASISLETSPVGTIFSVRFKI